MRNAFPISTMQMWCALQLHRSQNQSCKSLSRAVAASSPAACSQQHFLRNPPDLQLYKSLFQTGISVPTTVLQLGTFFYSPMTPTPHPCHPLLLGYTGPLKTTTKNFRKLANGLITSNVKYNSTKGKAKEALLAIKAAFKMALHIPCTEKNPEHTIFGWVTSNQYKQKIL